MRVRVGVFFVAWEFRHAGGAPKKKKKKKKKRLYFAIVSLIGKRS